MCDADGHAMQLKREGLLTDRTERGSGRTLLYSAYEGDTGRRCWKYPPGTARPLAEPRTLSINWKQSAQNYSQPFLLRLDPIHSPRSSAHPLVCLSRMERSYISVLHHSTVSPRHLTETLNGNWRSVTHNCQLQVCVQSLHMCVSGWKKKGHKYGHVQNESEHDCRAGSTSF